MKNSSNLWIFTLLGLILISCEKEKNSLPMDGDGNKYDTVVIGQQVWLNENLKTTKYINGDPIPLVTEDTDWSTFGRGAYCWYENNINNKDAYGALYNGYAAKASSFICPIGYHVPTISEWLTLIDFLNNSSEEIKQSFNIKKFGYRYWEGRFSTNYCGWWSSSSGQPNSVMIWLNAGGSGINNGYSIRCIKNN